MRYIPIDKQQNRDSVKSLVNQIADSKLEDTTDEIAMISQSETILYSFLVMLDATRQHIKHPHMSFLYNMIYTVYHDETQLALVENDIPELMSVTKNAHVRNFCNIAIGVLYSQFHTEEENY